MEYKMFSQVVLWTIKNPAANEGSIRGVGLIPGGNILEKEKWQPTPRGIHVSENSHG